MRFFLLLLFTFLYTPLLSIAGQPYEKKQQIVGYCDVPTIPPDQWPFQLKIIPSKKPVVFSNYSAKDVFQLQKQYFSEKSSPFLHYTRPPELSFYAHGLKLELDPLLKRTLTTDGRTCAQVVGATLIVHHEPKILLASELQLRSCVSNQAILIQLEHHKITQKAIAAFLRPQEQQRARGIIYEYFKNKGPAAPTLKSLSDQISKMSTESVSRIDSQADAYIRNVRRGLYTQEFIDSINAACSGDFQKAAGLSKP